MARLWFVFLAGALLISGCSGWMVTPIQTATVGITPSKTSTPTPTYRKTSTFLMDTLDHNKLLVSQNDASIMSIYNEIQNSATGILANSSYSVTYKTQIPPSGDIHDYMSQASYWWPNPNTSDELPYVYRDGQVNPESLLIADKAQFNLLVRDVETLSVAYYLSGNEAFANKAISLLRVWFIDPATRMNPNMDYAQFVPGMPVFNDPGGVIEMSEIPALMDSFLLISNSSSITNNDLAEFRAWLDEYLNWLLTEPKATLELVQNNNHATWYYQQVASIALFVGDRDLAIQTIEKAKLLISIQIKPNGNQPLETARTRSWWYSNRNLAGWQRLAITGDNIGIDLINYVAPNGASIRKAQDYLIPFAQNPVSWPYPNIDSWDNTEAALNMYNSARLYEDMAYQRTAQNLQNVTIIKWRQLNTKYYVLPLQPTNTPIVPLTAVPSNTFSITPTRTVTPSPVSPTVGPTITP